MLVCPIRNQVKGYPFEVSLPPDGAVTGVVLADQVKRLDWRARNAEKMTTVPDAVVQQVLYKLMLLLGEGTASTTASAGPDAA